MAVKRDAAVTLESRSSWSGSRAPSPVSRSEIGSGGPSAPAARSRLTGVRSCRSVRPRLRLGQVGVHAEEADPGGQVLVTVLGARRRQVVDLEQRRVLGQQVGPAALARGRRTGLDAEADVEGASVAVAVASAGTGRPVRRAQPGQTDQRAERAGVAELQVASLVSCAMSTSTSSRSATEGGGRRRAVDLVDAVDHVLHGARHRTRGQRSRRRR